MIDIKLQEQLRERFNPENSLLRCHQLRMLDMLKYIDEVCKENNISYWLASGTLLGAVRHGGFIPWDDDVDIEMLSKDYNRFIKIINTKPNCPYIIQTHKSDSAYLWQFGKLRDLKSEIIETYSYIGKDYKYNGIYVDIFPLDSAPSNFIHKVGHHLIVRCLNTNKLSNAILRKTIRSICYFITFNIIAPLVKLLPHRKEKLQHIFGSVFNELHDINDILPLKKMNFEDYSFNVPQNPDKYLRDVYGDYMNLPDIDKLINHVSNIRFL